VGFTAGAIVLGGAGGYRREEHVVTCPGCGVLLGGGCVVIKFAWCGGGLLYCIWWWGWCGVV